MAKYINTEEITPIMAEYVADVFSRKEHLDDISYGYCMEIADTFRRYAERAKQEQPKKSQKSCNDCPHCVDRKDQFGWHFKGCFGGPYNGKFIAEIDKCPLEMEQEEKKLPEGLEEAAHNFALHYDNGTCDGIAQDCFIAGAEWGAKHTKQKPELVQHPAIGYMYNADAGRGEQMKQAILALLKSDLIQVAGRGFTKTELIEWVETRPAEMKEDEK